VRAIGEFGDTEIKDLSWLEQDKSLIEAGLRKFMGFARIVFHVGISECFSGLLHYNRELI
jgi:hypothetical protein